MKKKMCELGIWRMIILFLIFLTLIEVMGRRYTSEEVPQLYSAELEETQPEDAPEGTISLKLTGMSMFRVNELYVNGKHIPIRYRENSGYSECRLSVDERVFTKGNTYKLSAGKSYPLSFGTIYKSNTIQFIP